MRSVLCAVLALRVLSSSARADDGSSAAAAAPVEPHATFALIIGVNRSVDPDAKALRYADDDAARYLDLFRSLGARSYVLARLDANTRRLHPQVAAEALLPVRAELDRITGALAADVEQARRRGVRTVVYFVYAGHGNVKEGRGYLALEDSRLDASELESRVVGRVHADQTHLIVDACYSYFLTLGRGPGGSRREIHGFSQLGGLTKRESVGLLLSTSSARESHEWSGVEAGVFSHEVRSGLYGAADVDNDGLVDYREIAAFIDRANGAIVNERYRPDVFAHPPKDSDMLVDLRHGSRSRIEVPAALGGHYFLEDSRGIRFADIHNGEHQAAYLIKPLNAGRLYLRRSRDDLEFQIPTGEPVVSLAGLTPQAPRNGSRGAANDAFELLFALPFDQRMVGRFALVPWAAQSSSPDAGAALPRWRLYTGLGLLGAAALTGVGASASLISAHALEADRDPAAPPDEMAAHNDRIQARRLWGTVGVGVAGLAAVTGLVALIWPNSPAAVDVAGTPETAMVSVRSVF